MYPQVFTGNLVNQCPTAIAGCCAVFCTFMGMSTVALQ
jgi:hypothetical protein